METVRPSPAGEMFGASAAATRTLEACALLLGAMVDEVRELTMMRTLSAEACEVAIAAFRMLSRFDDLRVDLETSLLELRKTRQRLGGHL